jgi:hypothetical protein
MQEGERKRSAGGRHHGGLVMIGNATTHLVRSYDLWVQLSRVLHAPAKLAQERFGKRLEESFAEHVAVLFRKPVNTLVERTRAGLPQVWRLAYEMVLDARTLACPVSDALGQR